MNRGGRLKRFTLIELLVVVAIIGILTSILLPALGKARQKGYSAVCKNNQKNLLYGASMFAMDNDDELFNGWANMQHNWSIPNIEGWDGILANQLEAPKDLFRCPADTSGSTHITGGGIYSEVPTSYKLNTSNWLWYTYSLSLDKVQNPTENVMFLDGSFSVSNWHHVATWEVSGNWGFVDPNYRTHLSLRHDNRFNLAFFDGHVQTHSFAESWESLGTDDDGNTITVWQSIF